MAGHSSGEECAEDQHSAGKATRATEAQKSADDQKTGNQLHTNSLTLRLKVSALPHMPRN